MALSLSISASQLSQSVADNLSLIHIYYVQVVKTQTTGSKTSYCETITVWIYAVCPSNDQHEKNNMLNALNEALTEDIELPQPYILVMQKDSGRQQTDQKENDKREAVEAYDFVVSYGLKFKED